MSGQFLQGQELCIQGQKLLVVGMKTGSLYYLDHVLSTQGSRAMPFYSKMMNPRKTDGTGVLDI